MEAETDSRQLQRLKYARDIYNKDNKIRKRFTYPMFVMESGKLKVKSTCLKCKKILDSTNPKNTRKKHKCRRPVQNLPRPPTPEASVVSSAPPSPEVPVPEPPLGLLVEALFDKLQEQAEARERAEK